jgi:prophage regulatory protein
MSEKILRKPEVLARVGIKNSTLYAWIAQGSFPRPLRIGSRAVGWQESQIDKWIEQKARLAGHSDA